MNQIIQILIWLFLASALYAQQIESTSFTDLFYGSMKPGVSCYRIPTLTSTPGGVLLAVADERVPSCKDLGQNENINIVLRSSSDQGRTWSELVTVLDFPDGQSASDPSFVVDRKKKEVFLFYNFMDHRNAKGTFRFQFIKSKDDGRTWSEPVDFTEQVIKPEWKNSFVFITSGNGIQTRDGKLLHTLVHVSEKAAYVFGSDDHGKNWYRLDYPLIPGDESKVIELADGRWLVNSRVNNLGFRVAHFSSDQGKTWQSMEQKNLIDPGCNAAILQIPMSGNHSKKSSTLFINTADASKRINLSIKKSLDGGMTWGEGKTLYPGSAAYVSATELASGGIGLLFERDGYGKISFTHLSLKVIRSLKN